MLIKLLNDFGSAIDEVEQRNTDESYEACVCSAYELSDYLQTQITPIRDRGYKIMSEMLPGYITLPRVSL